MHFIRLFKIEKKKKSLEKEIKPEEMEEALYTYPIPPVDLLIRTWEKRVSIFCYGR